MFKRFCISITNKGGFLLLTPQHLVLPVLWIMAILMTVLKLNIKKKN